jgi:hypothetical protein
VRRFKSVRARTNRRRKRQLWGGGENAGDETSEESPSVGCFQPVSLGVDQTNSFRKDHDIKTLEVQGADSEEKLDKEQLRSKRRSSSKEATLVSPAWFCPLHHCR